MTTKKELLERIDALEVWLTNVSALQRQLLDELGYEIKHRPPNHSSLYLEKSIERKLKGYKC